MNLALNLVLCGILLACAVAVSVYRNWLEEHCDHTIHLHSDSHDAAVINEQQAVCRRLEAMDKLKTGLIAAVIVYAVVIAGMATYHAWTTANL
jgi:hypothetical protein